jgi:hypothetical protein
MPFGQSSLDRVLMFAQVIECLVQRVFVGTDDTEFLGQRRIVSSSIRA